MIKLSILLVILFQLELLGAFGIKLGSYPLRPNIPPQIQQLGLPTQVVKEGKSFALYVGPYNTQSQAKQAQSNFNIRGNISQIGSISNSGFAVEILSTKDIKTIPKRIISKVYSSGMSPLFIMNNGLYRLLIGPFKTRSESKQAQSKLANIFGREMYTIDIPLSEFAQAIKPPNPTQAQLAQDIAISSNDNNEHIGYLEQQRQNAISKYSIDPYGETSSQQSIVQSLPQRQSGGQSDFSPSPRRTGGLLLSVAAISSNHDFVVNGKQIIGSFSPGFQIGYKVNDNTLFEISYFKPEMKKTTIFIQNSQTANISSEYSFMTSAQLQYRYFFPFYSSLFVSSNIGVDFVKQQVISNIPLNFGSSYAYNGIFIQSQLGLGAGYRIGRLLSLGIDYNAYLTLKTITSNVKIYLNLEF